MPNLPNLNFRSFAKHMAYLGLQSTNAEPAQSSFSNGVNGEEVDDYASNTSGKRGRVSDAQHSRPTKRRDTRSEHARQLTTDSAHLSDSSLRTFPQQYSHEDPASAAPKTIKMPVKPSRGHRPMNTLGHQQPFSQPPGFMNNPRPIKKTPQTSLDLHHSRGSNVAPARNIRGGDGFGADGEQVSKRRKLENGTSESSPMSEQIDLTNDDSQQDVSFAGKLVAHNGKPVKSPNLANGHQAPPLFENTESKSVDARLRTEQKKPRRSRDGQASSQNSSRATPADAHGGRPAVRPQPTDDSVIEITDGESHQQRMNTNTRQERAGKNQNLPPIDLEKGFEEIGPPARTHKAGSTDDINAATNLLGSSTHRTHGMEMSEQRGKRDMARQQKLPRGIPQPENGFSFSAFHHPKGRETTPLREKFKRNNPEPEKQPRERASQRLQATSRPPQRKVSPIEDDPDSEDELAGGNNLNVRTSRSISPLKQIDEKAQIQKLLDAEVPRKPPSPSDIAPTQFGHDRRDGRGQKTKPKDVSHDVSDRDHVRIPIKTIICRSCCLIEEHAELLWDDESCGFLVQCNDELQTVPGKSQLVCIGASESQVWTEVEGQHLLAVQIRGSVTGNSNGQIIIDFAGSDGLSLCFQHLLHCAAGQRFSHKHVPVETMQGIIKTQVPLLEQDYQKHSRLNSAAAARHVEAQKSVVSRREPGLSDEEQIKYDPPSPEPRSTPPFRMELGNRVKDRKRVGPSQQAGVANGIRSKYFSTEQTERRRSSRQPKPVRHRSPTPLPPERWTRIHNPERWAHSVVYPSEGPRRVTVDFNDLERLDEGEFLNDNVISFGLRYIEEHMAPEHKDSVHFFNTFFYTALTTKNGKKAFNYDAVKRWTKNKDMFSYPYIVVPINIDLHWFVAIICNLPDLSRKAVGLDGDVENDEQGVATESGDVANGSAASSSPPEVNPVSRGAVHSDVQDASQDMEQLSLSDNGHEEGADEHDGEDDVVRASDSIGVSKQPTASSSRQSTGSINKSAKKKKKAPPPPKKFDPDKPTIITLDSFGVAHSGETRYLKEYLNAEANEKRSMSVDPKQLQGMTAKGIPHQANFCDCGVFLLGYVEAFAKDPRTFTTKVLQGQMDKESDFAGFDPSTKRDQIRNQLLELHEEQEAERKAKKSGKKTAAKADGLGSTAAASSKPVGQMNTTGQRASPAKVAADDHAKPFVPKPTGQHLSRQPAEATISGTGSLKENEDSDLEVEVPRALHQAGVPASRHETTPPPPESLHNTAATDEEDEMLDQADTEFTSFDQRSPNQRDVAPGEDLLNPLERLLSEANETIQQGEMQPAARGSDDGADIATSIATDRSLQTIDIEGPSDRGIEVQDSQEQAPCVPQSQWAGKHMKFLD